MKNLEKAINESFKPTYTELTELIRLHSQDAREHDGVWSMPNGEDYYKHRLKIYTTTDYSPDEIHEIGLKLVESIQSEIRSILEAEGYDVSRPLATLYDELNNDPRFLFEDSDAGRQAILDEYTRIQNETYKILPQYFNELPIAEVIVKEFLFLQKKVPREAIIEAIIRWLKTSGFGMPTCMTLMPLKHLRCLHFHFMKQCLAIICK